MSHNVLIVDDSATIRSMTKRTLELAGLWVDNVFEAANGIEALARLADHDIAVMMLDINMPRMNGLQLLSRMKSHDRLRDIPIVIISTEGSTERIRQMEEMGIHGFVRKPFQPEQLRNVLKPLLGEQHAHADAAYPDGNDF